MAVVACSHCGTKNRVDEGAGSSRRPVCGKCETVLDVTAPRRNASGNFRQGDTIGPYRLVDQIGRGGFGEVWLAEKTGLVTVRFALKLPKDDDIDSGIFRQEASIWVQASGHTNIVPIVEADVHEVRRNGEVLRSNQTVIVSEYLRDGSLENRLHHETNTLSSETAVEIGQGILSGLKYLHTRQPTIIHRDLKPGNVLLQDDTPRLTDFGIARMLKTNSYSRTEHISGTLPYMAPEVFKGHYSVRTDVWAAGVILYQLLSGRLPFPQTDISAMMWAIANDQPDHLPSSVAGPLAAVVYKALNKDPHQRYQTADEMRRALVDAKQGRGNWVSTMKAPTPGPVPVPPIFPVDDGVAAKAEPPAPKALPKSAWIIAAAAILLSVLAFSFYIRKPATADAGAASKTSPFSTVDGNSGAPSPKMNTGPLVAAGQVELETDSEQPVYDKSGLGAGRITKWLVKPGDFVNPGVYLADLSFANTTIVGHLILYFPAKVMSINVNDGEEFSLAQELCRVARVSHVWVKAKLAPDDLARIPLGSDAFFKTKSKKVFKGRVESVDIQTGIVNIKLLDQHVFNSEGFLTIEPEARGDVSFDLSTAK